MEYRELIDAFAAKCGVEHPEIADVTFSQTDSPDKIRHNPDIGPVF